MAAIIQTLKLFLVEHLGARLGVLLCAMIPVIELRGAIVLGALLGMPWQESYLLSVLGNLLPVPFILLFITRVIARMRESKRRFWNKVGDFLVKRAERNRGRVEKYAFFGLCLFVSVPLPVTGAWTGALVAATIGMHPVRALLSILLGVLLSGVIVTLLAYGAFAVFSI